MAQTSQVAWIGWSHNPEVAGSNPAPAIGKAPETGLFRPQAQTPNVCRTLPHRPRFRHARQLHGPSIKEGGEGSSPSEGSAKATHKGVLCSDSLAQTICKR